MRPSDLRTLIGLRPPELDPRRRRLARCHDLGDMRAIARRRIPRAVFDYVDGGADDEITLQRNVEAYRRWEFVPRNLEDVASADSSVVLLGNRLPQPLVFSPTGYTRMMDPAGELAVARAAARAGLPYGLSTVASTSIEELATTGHRQLWFQLYIWRDRDLVYDLVERARAHGYKALEVSVDVPVSGNRGRDVRNGLTIPPRLTARALLDIGRRPSWWIRMMRAPVVRFANAPPGVGGHAGVTIENMTAQFDPSVGWDDLADIRSRWPGQLLLKGAIGPEDARRAIAAGVDGLHLSNHGGRQLDRTVPPIDLLPAVREAVGDEVAIVVDSGIRHGADVAVAIALGADAGAIGRAYLYGLMAAGEPGVDRVAALFAAQFTRTMQLLGVRTVDELRALGPELLRQREPQHA
ncbi:MAG TPA: alpha-hydroxy acid oxidase [Thermoleophilaceae bacterium]|nr:alpha-hydroxy acid oxidase [Thermoleophilaceae bacterium]